MVSRAQTSLLIPLDGFEPVDGAPRGRGQDTVLMQTRPRLNTKAPTVCLGYCRRCIEEFFPFVSLPCQSPGTQSKQSNSCTLASPAYSVPQAILPMFRVRTLTKRGHGQVPFVPECCLQFACLFGPSMIQI